MAVRVLDLISGKFLTDRNKKALEMSVNYNANTLDAGDAVIDFYKKSSQVERPTINEKSILAGNTYLQKNLLPESRKEIIDTINVFKDIIGLESAKEEAINNGYHTNIPEEGFNINF